MEYTVDAEKLPNIIRKGYEMAGALEWNLLFMSYVRYTLPPGVWEQDMLPVVLKDKSERTEDENRFSKVVASLVTVEKVLDKYPVLMLEPVLENLIEDTTSDLKNLKLPYPGFFINKKFKLKSGYLMGIYVVEMRQFLYEGLMEITPSKKQARELTELVCGSTGVEKNKPSMFFMTIYAEADKFTVILSDLREVSEGLIDTPKKIRQVTQQAMFYAANVANLITFHVDLNNPVNPKKDVRIIPFYPRGKPHPKKGKEKKESPYSIIRVFGNLKKYAEDYDKEKKKRAYTNSAESFIVRGHWRYLSHERYKAARFKTIWVPPFVKGMDKELHSRIIKLME